MDRTQYILGQRPKESLNGEHLGAGLQTIYTGVHKGYVRQPKGKEPKNQLHK